MPAAIPEHRFDLLSLPHPRHPGEAAFPGATCLNHDLHLIHILRGCGQMRIGSRAWAIAPGQAYLIPPLTPYACGKRAGQPLEMVNLHFHLDLEGGRPLLAARSMPPCFAMPHPQRTAGTLRRWARRWREGEPLTKAEVAADAHRLIVAYVQRWSGPPSARGAGDQGMVELRGLIREQAVGLYDGACLARQVHLSVSQMNRRFRAAYGLSPRQFHERHRLARVQALLHATETPIKELADRFGFRDQFYFSRWFARHCGLPPTAFRRQHRIQW